jgi:hypothetical protein
MLANLHRDEATTSLVEQLFAGFRNYQSAATSRPKNDERATSRSGRRRR